MQVLVLSRYGSLGASSRVRMLLYRDALELAGINLTISPLLDDEYVKRLYAGRRAFGRIVSGYWRRFRALLGARRYDLIWLEKEALPWLPSFFEIALFPRRVPLVVEFDDAIFHNYDQHRSRMVRHLLGRRIDELMAKSDLVLAGNEYLASRARSAGARSVEIIPTVVNLDRYAINDAVNSVPVVGWIGSPATQHFLEAIKAPLAQVATEGGLQFVGIGASDLPFSGAWSCTKPWSEKDEAKAIGGIDVGVMPLPDDPWERGKCGYKLIQYMAAGKPVIASPVGANAYIVRHGENGFLASTGEEWEKALRTLLADKALRERMGRAGRRRVEEEFCLAVTAPQLVSLFQKLVGG